MVAQWSTNPTDEFQDLASAVSTTISCDSFLGSDTYTLSSDMTPGQTSAWLDTTGLPTKGILKIGTERISYTGKTDTTITGLTRGTRNTTPAAHSASDAITTFNVAHVHTKLTGDLRDYQDHQLPAIAVEVTGATDDERAAFGAWDHGIEFEVWVTCRDYEYAVAAGDCEIITSEVRRLFRTQEKGDTSNLQDLLDNGLIFVGRTDFTRPDDEHWDGSRWWKQSLTRIRVTHEQTE